MTDAQEFGSPVEQFGPSAIALTTLYINGTKAIFYQTTTDVRASKITLRPVSGGTILQIVEGQQGGGWCWYLVSPSRTVGLGEAGDH